MKKNQAKVVLSIPVHYEYEYTANARIASFKEVFTAEEMYASPDHVFAEAIIYIAELFGFDPSVEACLLLRACTIRFSSATIAT